MGEVFLARLIRQDAFEKLVVIKRLLPQHSRDEAFQGLFRREARLAALLSHQNIVQIFDFGEVDGQLFICMELVDGLDAASLGAPLPGPLALAVLAGAARGLDYAHRKAHADGTPLGLVHRDVSPRNLMVSREGEVKWIDFGLARALGRDGRDGLVAGTVAYMSPEQAEGRALDARSDLFSLGVVAYELLTGRRPWSATRARAHAQACVTEPVAAPSLLAPALGLREEAAHALDQVVLRLLAADPGDRFQSARALLEALPAGAPPQALADFVRARAALRQQAPLTQHVITASASSGPGVPEVTAPASLPLQPLSPLDVGAGAGFAAQPLEHAQREPHAQTLSALIAQQRADSSSPLLTTPITPLRLDDLQPSPRRLASPVAAPGARPLNGSSQSGGAKRAQAGKQLPPLAPRRPVTAAHPQAVSKALWLALGVLLGVGGIVLGVALAMRHGPEPVSEAAAPAPPPTPAPPTAAPGVGVWALALSATPPGARVLLDGEEVGVAPLRLAGLVGPGDYALRVESEGYAPYQEVLQVDAQGGEVRREVALAPLPALLRVSISPATVQSATVEVRDADADGIEAAASAATQTPDALGAPLRARQPWSPTQPLSLAPGDVMVTVTSPGYAPWKQRVSLASGQHMTLAATLPPLPATLRLQTGQQGLRAVLTPQDEPHPIRRCDLPCTLIDLSPSTYTLEVTDAAGERPGSITRLVITAGADVTLPVRLSTAAVAAAVSKRGGVRLSAQGASFVRAGKASGAAALGEAGGVLEVTAPGEITATVRLEPAPSGSSARFLLSLRSKPWARFEVNGVSYDALHYFPLTAGDHTVKLLPEGKRPPAPISLKLSVSALTPKPN